MFTLLIFEGGSGGREGEQKRDLFTRGWRQVDVTHNYSRTTAAGSPTPPAAPRTAQRRARLGRAGSAAGCESPRPGPAEGGGTMGRRRRPKRAARSPARQRTRQENAPLVSSVPTGAARPLARGGAATVGPPPPRLWAPLPATAPACGGQRAAPPGERTGCAQIPAWSRLVRGAPRPRASLQLPRVAARSGWGSRGCPAPGGSVEVRADGVAAALRRAPHPSAKSPG